jgi:hypothetical protein
MPSRRKEPTPETHSIQKNNPSIQSLTARVTEAGPDAQVAVLVVRARGVAAQVAFESKGLKPGYHFIGSRR